MSTEIMNAEELANYLGIATSTVYKKVEYRQIPFTKIGTLLRFPKWIIRPVAFGEGGAARAVVV